ncbi:hypothetical protein ACFY2N_34590 [Streptomyces rubiginosohelvolus]|uniref:hypothetical protein n=1 Tax=Streptomyces rubiginosohelvolus TaxID=67362 RepID=UPI0036C5EBE2
MSRPAHANAALHPEHGRAAPNVHHQEHKQQHQEQRLTHRPGQGPAVTGQDIAAGSKPMVEQFGNAL